MGEWDLALFQALPLTDYVALGMSLKFFFVHRYDNTCLTRVFVRIHSLIRVSLCFPTWECWVTGRASGSFPPCHIHTPASQYTYTRDRHNMVSCADPIPIILNREWIKPQRYWSEAVYRGEKVWLWCCGPWSQSPVYQLVAGNKGSQDSLWRNGEFFCNE